MQLTQREIEAAIKFKERHQGNPKLADFLLSRSAFAHLFGRGAAGSDVDHYYPKIDLPIISEFKMRPLRKAEFNKGQMGGLADMCIYYAFTLLFIQLEPETGDVVNIKMYYRNEEAPTRKSYGYRTHFLEEVDLGNNMNQLNELLELCDREVKTDRVRRRIKHLKKLDSIGRIFTERQG
jgi:hypothetical protein